MKLEKAIKFLNGSLLDADPAFTERDVTKFVIDSREIKAGDVFFALSQPEYANSGFNGDFEDSTKYVVSAFEKGAAAAVVRRDRFEERKEQLVPFAGRLIFVEDVIASLQRLANKIYLEWNMPVIAITGSAGKTTAKELTAHVMEEGGRKVLRNIKNFNNGLGLPLTVVRLAENDDYDVAVLEMGMSSPHQEIARLCTITPPDVAVELNVLPVHVEHLGSIENVAVAKAELVEGMKENGTAVLNADDHRVAAMGILSKGETITYGIENLADVMAKDISVKGFGTTRFTLVTPKGSAIVDFPLNGKHNILNALAAAAVGHRFGMSPSTIAGALNSAECPPQRGEILRFAAGFIVINDSYNSNPDALLSMVNTLVSGAEPSSRKIVVAGEMLELGENAAEIHRQTGRKIAEMGVDVLIGIRGLGSEIVNGAKVAGIGKAIFADDSEQAGNILVDEVRANDVILIKGSRGVRTEKVLDALGSKFDLEAVRGAEK